MKEEEFICLDKDTISVLAIGAIFHRYATDDRNRHTCILFSLYHWYKDFCKELWILHTIPPITSFMWFYMAMTTTLTAFSFSLFTNTIKLSNPSNFLTSVLICMLFIASAYLYWECAPSLLPHWSHVNQETAVVSSTPHIVPEAQSCCRCLESCLI